MGAIHNTFDDLLDEHDLARITKRSVAAVRHDRLFKKNCPFVKIGSSVRYLRSDVEVWLRSLPRRGGQQEMR